MGAVLTYGRRTTPGQDGCPRNAVESVLAAVRDRYATWQDRVVTDGGDPVEATVARLAADGLWLADLLGLAPPEDHLRERVLARLLDMCD